MPFPKPREKLRKGNFPYIFVEHEDFPHQTDWTLERSFEAEWLSISKSGLIIVKANKTGYAWDGCSPKFDILNLVVVGVPDGHFDYRTGKAYTYRASMVHDALYQYLDSIPVSKADVDLLFLIMLGDFKPRHIYYYFVKHCGGKNVVQQGLQHVA
ncbi:MAG: hypothetical protein R8K20_09915 [Gallionellaceae bacterium]